MPETKPKTTKGKGLKKKYGPFPAYVYLVIGAVIVVGYIYFRRKQNQTSPTDQFAGSLNQQVIPSGVIVPPSGAATDQNQNAGTDSSVTMPTDYITNTDLQNGLDNLSNSVGAQIAAVTFPTPTVNITVPPAHVATQTAKSKTAAKKAAAPAKATPIKYFTKKTQVHLRAGQTLHFAKGKGYYAK